MRFRFSETSVIQAGDRLLLVDLAGNVLLELSAEEADLAAQDGFLDPEDLHYTLFEYSRMMLEIGVVQGPESEIEVGSRAEGDLPPLTIDVEPDAPSRRALPPRRITEADLEFLRHLGIRWD